MPTATFVSTPFRTLATTRRQSLHGESAQLVWIPHPVMNLLPDAVESLAESVVPEVLKAVARSGPAEGARP